MKAVPATSTGPVKKRNCWPSPRTRLSIICCCPASLAAAESRKMAASAILQAPDGDQPATRGRRPQGLDPAFCSPSSRARESKWLVAPARDRVVPDHGPMGGVHFEGVVAVKPEGDVDIYHRVL